jgi:hypothetical protein
MTVVYGLAEYDRYTGMVDWNINLPMDGVQSGNLYEFLKSAGENGWEMCAAFPVGTKGQTRALPLSSGQNTRICEDAAEEIAFIFKQVD